LLAEIGTVDFHMPFQNLAGLNFLGHRLAQLAEQIGDKEVNVRNKLSRGKFSAAFLLKSLKAVGVTEMRL